jgi:hypothetical protein
MKEKRRKSDRTQLKFKSENNKKKEEKFFFFVMEA